MANSNTMSRKPRTTRFPTCISGGGPSTVSRLYRVALQVLQRPLEIDATPRAVHGRVFVFEGTTWTYDYDPLLSNSSGPTRAIMRPDPHLSYVGCAMWSATRLLVRARSIPTICGLGLAHLPPHRCQSCPASLTPPRHRNWRSAGASSMLNSVRVNLTPGRCIHLTACVSCRWAGGDNVSLAEPALS